MRRRRTPGGLELVTLAALAGGALAGCGLSAGKVEFVVYFMPEATDQQKEGVRNACPGNGQAVLEPRDRSDSKAARTYPVRYVISKASSQDRSDVIRCVSGHPGV